LSIVRAQSALVCCLLWAVLGLATAGSAAQEHAVALRLAAGDSVALAPYLENDRAWLRTWPAALLASPAADSLATVRDWVQQWYRTRQSRDDATRWSAPVPTTVDSGAVAVSYGVRDVLSRLRDRWLDRGYLAVKCRAGKRASDGVSRPDSAAVLTIDPGPRFRIGEVTIDGVDFPERTRLLADFLPRSGAYFDPPAWDAAVERLLVEIGQTGRPFASWLQRRASVDVAGGIVHVNAVLFPGAVTYLGPITSDLPAGPGSGFLVRATGLHAGTLFRQRDLENARRRLLARGLYTQVGEPLVYRTTAGDTVGIHWPVVPAQRANRLAVMLGLSRETQDAANRISGQVDLDLPNLAGSGRHLTVRWSDDGRQKTFFGFGYTEPLAFGTPLDASVALDQEVVKDSYTRFRIDQRWQMAVVGFWAVEVGLGWDRSTFPAGELQGTRRLRGRAAFLHKRGDHRYSGWSTTLALETARRSTSLRVDSGDGGLGAVAQQRIYELDLAGELWLAAAWSLAGRLSYRRVGDELEVVPLSEQFLYGGARTLRGYREQEFHGSEVAFGGVELRIGRAGRSRLYTFFDMGYFEFAVPTAEQAAETTRRQDVQRGFGLGIDTRTRGGDISLAVGFPGQVNFDEAKLHVALQGSF